MDTREFNISDINRYKTDAIKAKENLATNIISLMGPMVDETIRERKENLNVNINKLKMIKNNINEMNDEIQNLSNKYKFLSLKKALLDIIEKLITTGLIYQSTLTVEVKNILMNIDKMKEKELKIYYKKLSLVLDSKN